MKSEDDPRSEFERDYDRTVFSTPVRRLQDKAQVFPLEPHDGIRTRLTHSLEVSSVARDVARYLFIALAEKGVIGPEQVHEFSTIAATCGLLHDLGNPPFGHAGEVAIQQWFHAARNRSIVDSLRGGAEPGSARYAEDFLAFDGNAQTVRLITKLQVLADEFGLNLTCGTLAAATKYIATSDKISDEPHQMSKLGVFASEANLIQAVRAEVGLEGSARHPVTFVVEACDDIVYSSVDLEDGIKKGVIAWDQLVDELTAELGGSSPILAAVKNGVSRQLGCHKPVDHIDQDAFAQAFRIQSIGRVVPAVRAVFERRFSEIDSGTYGGELLADDECEAKAYVEACKKIARRSVYACKDVLRLELMGRKIIHDLMDVFWEGARIGSAKAKAKDYPGKSYRLISSNYRHVFEQQLEGSKGGAAETYHRVQLVVDYVAGMTDTFARELHRRLSNG